MLRINEAAKRLGVTPGTLRRWEEEGLIQPDRTAGGERRYHEGQLDQLMARLSEGSLQPRDDREVRPVKGLSRTSQASDQEGPEVVMSPYSPPPPWEQRVHEARADLEVRKLQKEMAELERVEQEAESARERQARAAMNTAKEEERKRQTEALVNRRLAGLRSHGEMLAAFSGAPTDYKAAVTRELGSFVTPEQFPETLPLLQAYEYIQARVEKILKPWRDLKDQEQQREKLRRHHESIIQAGRSRCSWKTINWDRADREQALSDVEDALSEEVQPDWTQEEVFELVDETLDDWEE